jgi:hypothetical protein
VTCKCTLDAIARAHVRRRQIDQWIEDLGAPFNLARMSPKDMTFLTGIEARRDRDGAAFDLRPAELRRLKDLVEKVS